MADQVKQLPRYRCHKEVEAVKIAQIDPTSFAEASTGSAWIVPAEKGIASFWVDASYMQKHQPKVGGYYVRYKDGYESWSPAKEFEDGYTLIAESEAPAPGEAVYGWNVQSVYCGDCGNAMWAYFPHLNGQKLPQYECTNDLCPRKGKRYELSTAHAVILREVAQPAAPEAKE